MIADPAKLLKEAHGLWAAVVFFSLFSNLLILVGPLYMLQVYERVLTSHALETLVALSVIAGFAYGGMAVLDWSRGRLLARLGGAIGARCQGACVEFDLSRRARGQEDGQALAALAAFERGFASSGMVALFDLPWAPIFFGAIFLLHPALALLALLGGGVVLGLGAMALRLRSPDGRMLPELPVAFARDAACLSAQGAGAALARRLVPSEEALAMAERQRDRRAMCQVAGRTFRLALQSAVLGLGAFLVVGGSLGAGAMIAASILTGRALAPLEQVLAHWPVLRETRRGWEALREVSENRNAPEFVKGDRVFLEIRAATFAGSVGLKPTLRGISLSLRAGQVLGVLGPTGAGKTTLVSGLLGLRPCLGGVLRLSGGAHLPDSATPIGYLPQTFCLHSGTIAENIARLGPDIDMEAVIVAARNAGIHEWILTLRDGYSHRIEPDQMALSTGEIQRVCLARALFGDPPVLVLDAPDSSLDADGIAALQTALRVHRAEGGMAVVVSHRPPVIGACSHVVVLNAGRQVAFGPRDEVLAATTSASSDQGAAV